MNLILRLQAGLNSLAASISAALLLALSALLLLDVALRAMSKPIFGSQEIAEMVMVIVIFGGLAQLEAKGGQIRVDLFAKTMGPKLNAVIDRIAAALSAILWTTLAYSVMQAAELTSLLGLKTNLLGLPRAPFQWALAAAAGLAALAALGRALYTQRDQNV